MDKVLDYNSPTNSRTKLGVYIHIPFCRQKCLYCDFPSRADGESSFQDYTAALCREIAGKGGVLSSHVIDSIYFGGGTPTVLPVNNLVRIIDCLCGCAQVASDAEISIEANPGTLNSENSAALHAAGVNRISIGVQAFDDRLLALAGRIHSAAEAVRAVSEAAAGGFDNISVDLMFGLPGQTKVDFETSLRQAVKLPVSHISAYGLKLEEGTPFHRLQAAGELELPDEEEEAAMYDLATDFLPQHGFERYEISNYALAGSECRHNLKYWRYLPYLGLGAAAHSFIAGQRQANVVADCEYIRRIFAGEDAVEYREVPEPAVAIAEYVFLALRTVQGLAFQEFASRFGLSFTDRFAGIIEKLAGDGLIAVERGSVRLTVQGMRFGNIVFASFLPD